MHSYSFDAANELGLLYARGVDDSPMRIDVRNGIVRVVEMAVPHAQNHEIDPMAGQFCCSFVDSWQLNCYYLYCFHGPKYQQSKSF